MQKIEGYCKKYPKISKNAVIQLAMHAAGAEDISRIIVNENLDSTEEQMLELYLEQHSAGMPLEYITQRCNFYGIDLYVNNNVLIPRTDTEVLVTEAINIIGDENLTVLDLCTGSGCIAISIARHCTNANIVAVDSSPEALEVCNANIIKTGCKNRVTTMQSDITKTVPKGNFKVVVSNPPYIATGIIPQLSKSVKDYEPRIALDGGADGLDFYRHIFEYIKNMKNVTMLLEIGFDQERSITELAKSYGIAKFNIVKDFAHNSRVLSVML